MKKNDFYSISSIYKNKEKNNLIEGNVFFNHNYILAEILLRCKDIPYLEILPKITDYLKELPNDKCYFIENGYGIQIINSLCILNINELYFHPSDIKYLPIKIQQNNEIEYNTTNSPITTPDDTSPNLDLTLTPTPRKRKFTQSLNESITNTNTNTINSNHIHIPLPIPSILSKPSITSIHSNIENNDKDGKINNNNNNNIVEVDDLAATQALRELKQKINGYKEIEWNRGTRKGICFHVPFEDINLIDSKLELLGWKISSNIKVNEWWKNLKAYFPSWSSYNNQSSISKKLIPGIDVFWCLDDCLKYLKLFGNLPPVNYKKGGLRSLRVNLFEEDYSSYIKYSLEDLKDQSINTIFNFIWPLLSSTGWKIIEISSSLNDSNTPVNRIAIPYWSKITSESFSLTEFSKLIQNHDYFFYIQDAFHYLQAFGNIHSKKNLKDILDKNKNYLFTQKKYPLLPFPLINSDGVEDVTDQLERRTICNIVENDSILDDTITVLQSFGWKFNEKYNKLKDVIISPWGVSKLTLNANGNSDIVLEQQFDYFGNLDNLKEFLIETGSCRHYSPKNKIPEDQLSVCSSSENSEEIESKTNKSTKNKNNTNISNNNKNNNNNSSKSVVNNLFQKSSRPSRVNLTNTINNNNNDNDNKSNNNNNVRDRCPKLKNNGLEGKLKQIINTAGDNYLFPRISPILVELGWKFNVQTTKWIEGTVSISPWGWRLCENSGDKEMLLVYGCDYFIENKEIVTYILEHGNQPYHITGSGGLPLSTSNLKIKDSIQYSNKSNNNNNNNNNSDKPTNSITSSPITINNKKLNNNSLIVTSSTSTLSTSNSTNNKQKQKKQNEQEDINNEDKKEDKKEDVEKVQQKQHQLRLQLFNSNTNKKELKDLENELAELVDTAGNNYLFPIISSTLIDLGWNLNVKVRSVIDSFHHYIIISPWGWKLYQNSIETKKDRSLLHGLDYFLDHKEVEVYVRKHFNQPCHPSKVVSTFGRRSFASSFSTLLTSQIIPIVDDLPSSPTSIRESENNNNNQHEHENSNNNNSSKRGIKNNKNLTISTLLSSQSKSKIKSPSRSSTDLNPLKRSRLSNSSSNDNIFDKCPCLSNDGLEGEMKKVINSAGNNYIFPLIETFLDQLGWTINPYQNKVNRDWVYLAPWAVPFDPISAIQGVDYFYETREIVAYILKYGNKRHVINYSERRSSKISTDFNLSNSNINNNNNNNNNNNKKESKIKSKKVDKIGLDDITLSQLDITPNVPIDTKCSPEIKVLIRMATYSRPRLNLSSFKEVWDILEQHNWRRVNQSSSNNIYLRPMIESIKDITDSKFKSGIDYFDNEDEILEFIKNQIIVRGGNYFTLVDRALYYPNASFNDEKEDDNIDDNEVYINANNIENEENDCSNLEDDFNITSSAEKNYNQQFFNNVEPYQLFSGRNNDIDVDNDVDGSDLPSFTPSIFQVDHDNLQLTPHKSSSCHSPPIPTSSSSSLSSSTSLRLGLITPETLSNIGIKRNIISNESNVTQTIYENNNNNNNNLQEDLNSEINSQKFGRSKSEDSTYRGISPSPVKSPFIPQIPLSTAIERALERLHPSYQPKNVFGRADEYREIFNFLRQRIIDNRGGSLRISGQPGQGKTITTKCAIQVLEEESKDKFIPEYIWYWMNGAENTSLRDIIKCISPTSQNSNNTNHDNSNNNDPITLFEKLAIESKSFIILFMDEIDLLSRGTREQLLTIANSPQSKLVLVGLSNSIFPEPYLHEISFSVYDENQLRNILLSLSENLFEDNAFNFIAKMVSSSGDVRQMMALARRCVQKASDTLRSSEDYHSILFLPAKPIVNMKIVSLCRKESLKTGPEEAFKNLQKNARILLISLIISFEPGQLFSLQQMYNVVNSFYHQLKIERIDMMNLCRIGDQLIEDNFLHPSPDKFKKINYISLNHYQNQQETPLISIGMTAQDILDIVSVDDIGKVAFNELQKTVNDRKLKDCEY